MDDKDLVQALGRMEGKLDMMLVNQQSQGQRMDSMDKRLRAVEVKAAQTGAIAGGFTAVLTALGVEFAKRQLGL